MNFLSGIFNNKAILNSALGAIRNWIEKDGISVIVIAKEEHDESSETPGLSIRSFKTGVGILDGKDLEECKEFMEYRDAYRAGNMKLPAFCNAMGDMLSRPKTDEVEKEVSDDL